MTKVTSTTFCTSARSEPNSTPSLPQSNSLYKLKYEPKVINRFDNPLLCFSKSPINCLSVNLPIVLSAVPNACDTVLAVYVTTLTIVFTTAIIAFLICSAIFLAACTSFSNAFMPILMPASIKDPELATSCAILSTLEPTFSAVSDRLSDTESTDSLTDSVDCAVACCTSCADLFAFSSTLLSASFAVCSTTLVVSFAEFAFVRHCVLPPRFHAFCSLGYTCRLFGLRLSRLTCSLCA